MKHNNIKFRNGNIIIIPTAECYKDCFTLIKSDYYRILGKEVSPLYILLRLLCGPFASPLLWFRLCQYKGLFYFISKFIYRLTSIIHNVYIPSSTKIGYGFYIGHGICIVINEGTIIGNNVNISQFLNIGTNHNTPAKIADNVYVGPGVCIVEDVEIGDSSTIGAGAVVTKDIPANATAVGVPAKVINYDKPGRYTGNRWTQLP